MSKKTFPSSLSCVNGLCLCKIGSAAALSEEFI